MVLFFKKHSLSATSLLVYRNPTNLGLLTLYPATLLNSFSTSSSFLMESLGFSMHSVMLPANTDRLICSLPIWMPHFLFFVWLLWLGESSENGHSLSCSWPWRESSQFFTTEDDVSYGFFVCGLYYVEVCFL